MSHPYVSRVEIQNFRNFGTFSVDLEPSSVLVGENMCGKSNFLHALRLVLDPDLADGQRYLRAEDFWDGLKRPFKGAIIEVKVYIRGFENDAPAKAVLADCIVEKSPRTALVTYQYRPRALAKKTTSAEADYEFVIFGGEDEKHRVGTDIRRWLRVVVLPAMRDAAAEIRSWRRSPLRPLLDRARKEIASTGLEGVQAKLKDAEDLLLKKKAVKDLQRAMNQHMEDLVGPTHSIEAKLGFATSEAEQLLRSLRLYTVEGQTRPLDDASLGAANVVFLALLLQELDAKRSEKAIAGAVLAVEEPEAHLHPHLQRLLFRHFLRRGHSVVVSTHSPHLASVAPLDSLVLLRIKDGQTRAHAAHELGLSAREKEDLERYLDVTRAEMVFAKGVIFVEGAAELFLLPAFAHHRLRELDVADSLDELGISVCSVNGTDFQPFSTLTMDDGWAIPNVIVTDGDERPEKTGSKRYEGLARGARLLVEREKKRLLELLEQNKPAVVRRELAAADVFVGKQTLEIDLLPGLCDEIVATFREFHSGKLVRQRFEAATKGAIANDTESQKEYLARIEGIGKGRFAQALAAKITEDHDPTEHVASAIDRIAESVVGAGNGTAG